MENSRDLQKKLTLDNSEQNITAKSHVLVKKRSDVSQEESVKSKKGSNRKLLATGGNSSRRNDDFLEYVIGADTLMPKRVRSRMSDLPYSSQQSPQSQTGLYRNPDKMFNSQNKDDDRPKKSRRDS